jgi:hypothetical protein
LFQLFLLKAIATPQGKPANAIISRRRLHKESAVQRRDGFFDGGQVRGGIDDHGEGFADVFVRPPDTRDAEPGFARPGMAGTFDMSSA